MRFRRLKLSGFKSFVEPAELRIEAGLTGVVGPNGCGKSNLLEAIRWVMGESSAKSMRGGGMDDVIFAGTATRPPRDFAEVALLTEDADANEVEVVRRIERGAGSAYRVNGRDTRAKDVSLIFADAATGAHSPALVSQGRIAAVIAAKPAERRQLLEEAAGISGLHARRKDAENKLRATEANLARLEDAMSSLDTQINALRRQARAAERYKALSAQIKLAEARMVYAKWRDAAAAAQTARSEAARADAQVTEAQAAVRIAQQAQAAGAQTLARARDALTDRRDDASAHGHRMATLKSQLEAAEQRVTDLNREHTRLERDRGDAGRLTSDSAAALARLESELADGEAVLADEEARRPALGDALDSAERASRAAELALAQAAASQAGVEAEWRIAEAEVQAAGARRDRLGEEQRRQQAQLDALTAEGDVEAALAQAAARREAAGRALAEASAALDTQRARKDELQRARDDAANALAAAKAELAGIEREHGALLRDRESRAKQASGKHGLPAAIDRLRVAPGYERALAAVLGRDARALIGPAPVDGEGRHWTGAPAPAAVPCSLAAQVQECPPELTARLALVRVAEADDGRTLAPGEWLVTLSGRLRRWDGFVAAGEGAAEAARLEAENRFAQLDAALPPRRAAAAKAQTAQTETQTALSALQTNLVSSERAVATASEAERGALRELDRAEDAKARRQARSAELEAAGSELAERLNQAGAEQNAAEVRRISLPDPAEGRAALAGAQAHHDAARQAMQSAIAARSAHDQALSARRERTAAQRSEIKGWQARAGDAEKRLAGMAQRFEEIEGERAIAAAKPPALMREIEDGEAIRARVTTDLTTAEAALAAAEATARQADAALTAATELLAAAREARAASAARAEAEEQRRTECARLSGDRFQCPPPLLPERFAFASSDVGPAEQEAAGLDKLSIERERLGPVNLVAADELAESEARQAEALAGQNELAEAVNRLRGSIGSLNREGRERLRAAFTQVDTHFRRLFTQLFQGGQAELAMVDSDDPLEAGLEILAQPPGKRLQSLSLLSGGEQALTAVALIFALFLTNPAPICVLDEVDAPLDDANVDRFCDLLDVMVRETETRYLIVTHNAVTMSRMHRLFGVTMMEKGVSRLVSVDLGGAEELLAAE